MDSPASADSGYRALRVTPELEGRRQRYLFELAIQQKGKDHRSGRFPDAAASAAPQLRRGEHSLAMR
ncbi:MAG: hypothetical protein OXN89_09915 [Bryobacterales bacterium]|nr:hypothetical protein [Bryobacterales bacterium]